MGSFAQWRIPFFIALALASCIINVMFLEKLIKSDKECSNLITFACFALLSVDGFLFTSKCFTKKRVIPLRYNALLVTIFFFSNVANNLVFRFHVPMTLHMIFKSGSLLTSLILGALLLKRSYSTSRYIAVAMITVGIIFCTYASSKPEQTSSTAESFHYGEFLIGLALLTGTLISASYLGVLQERITEQFGSHPRENLFYNHLLPLPFFLLLYKDLAKQIDSFNRSELYVIPFTGVAIPYMWGLLICNTFFQYICINSVFQLTSTCTSLTVTLVVTIRKFLSLLISIFYFGNEFTFLHWVGATLVFGGSAVFAGLHRLVIKEAPSNKKDQ
ncbi:nucleotide sugar transporter SLC35B4-like [Watersipora subatra]|uniref:nucleotide sugar transporter SLC35B4-like n=1 Tax=Watersipora subatra TaxID=2589382 RepID=UPI00355BAB40